MESHSRGGGAQEPAIDRTKPPSAHRVLLVEDSRVNVKIARNLLQQWNLEVDVACNGAEAVACVRARAYDVILMDLQMPVMDGFEATAAIRQLEDEARAGTPIVALTASETPEDHARIEALRINGFVAKPIQRADLFDVLTGVLFKKGRISS